MSTPGPLTHLDAAGAARMVDVSGKDVTARTAARHRPGAGLAAEVVELLRGEGVPKGDALAIARIAGIMGAKRTPDLSRCATRSRSHGVDGRPRRSRTTRVEITATVRTADRTGVEMEALTAVAVAALDRDRHGQGGRQGRGHHRRAGRGEDRRQDRRLEPDDRRLRRARRARPGRHRLQPRRRRASTRTGRARCSPRG